MTKLPQKFYDAAMILTVTREDIGTLLAAQPDTYPIEVWSALEQLAHVAQRLRTIGEEMRASGQVEGKSPPPGKESFTV